MAAQPRTQYGKLATRYAALTAKAKAGDSLIPDTAYADFLRDLEKNSLPNAVPTSPPSLHQSYKGEGHGQRRTNGPQALTANSVRERAQQSIDETNRQLKAIEDHMWQHRQEERALKRTEMDVVKQRKNLENTMRKLNTELSRRQEEESQQMSLKEGGLVAYQQKALHDRGSSAKEHTKTALAGRQRVNEQTKKFMKNEQEMCWKYQNLLNVLEMKKNEIEQLSSEFEKCIRAKEEEQHSLKKDLASLAISMNMEAQKKRHIMAENSSHVKRATAKEILNSLQQQEREEVEKGTVVTAGRRYENRKRDLEQNTHSKQERLQAKQRQEGRKLMDVQTKQRMNLEQQRFTASEAEHVHLDMMGRQIEARIHEVEAKKTARVDALQRQTAARNKKEVEAWSRRMGERENEAKRREHAERLKQLSRVVNQYEAHEHALYSKAREAEGVRRKQVQVVEKLQEDLEHLKQRNAIKLKEAALQAQKAEKEMHQKILREMADLTRAANIQHEATHSLVTHRQRTQEDKRMLAEEKKEHQRRSRIANRTALS